MSKTDSVRPAPTALFTMPRYPGLPSLRAVESGADLEQLIREELGGEPERHVPPNEEERFMGVIDTYERGELLLHVHSHSNAVADLGRVIDQFRLERHLEEVFGPLGISVIVVGGMCICGQCSASNGSRGKA